MRELTYNEAAVEAVAEEMRRDPKIFYMSTAASLYVSSRIVLSSHQAANTSSVACSGSGNGLASAKATAASSAAMISRSIVCSSASSR